MNRASARRAQTFLALTVLGLGIAACGQATSTETPSEGLPTTTTTSPAAPPAASPATLAPNAPSEPNASSAPNAPNAPNAPTSLGAHTANSGVSSTSCSQEQRWGTGPEAGGAAMSPSPLYLTRVGRHACFDRVVFDLNGSQAVGFAARYVPVVRADGSGKAVPVAGRAALEVVVRAPILGADNQGHQPWREPPTVGEHLVAPAKVTGWSSLRAVTYAGSFEGQTTVAVGVRERLPFRVSVSSERDIQHVILDISH